MIHFRQASSTKGADMFKDTTTPINPDGRARALMGAGLAVAAVSLFAVPAPSHAQQSGADAAMDEIIVTTARRREESLMEVPLSISVLGGVDLERVGAVDIVEVAKQSPNVTLEVSRGTNTTLTAFIRGVGQQDHVRIRNPVRRGDEYLVAFVPQHLCQVVEGMLGAAGNDDLPAFVGQSVVALEFGDDGILQRVGAADERVICVIILNGADGGLFDRLRRGKIRFAGAEADDIDPLLFQSLSLGGDGQCHRRLNFLDALREFHQTIFESPS